MAALYTFLLAVFSVQFLARPLAGELFLSPSDKLTVSDDYDLLSFPKASGQEFAYWEVHGVVVSTGRNYTGHVALLSGGLPDTFSYSLPADGQNSYKYPLKIPCPLCKITHL